MKISHAPARLLHPVRRRVAMVGLGRQPPPASVWFVCRANLCRSPFAAELLRLVLPQPLRDAIRIDSAGLVGAGRSPPPEAVGAAARHGVALSAHRSKPLTGEVVAEAGLLVVMDPAQRRWIHERFAGSNRDVMILGDLDPQWIDGRVIPDPAGQPEEAYEQTYAQIARCVRELARAIRKRPPVPIKTSSSSA